MNAIAKFRKNQNSGIQEIQNQIPVEEGLYVTKDQRASVALEVKKSHFVLGTDQDDFRTKNEIDKYEQNWNINNRKNGPKPTHKSKQTSVQLGINSKFSGETTQKQDFIPKPRDKQKAQQALEAKQELRKAHFNFGNTLSGPELFTTTNQEKQRGIAEKKEHSPKVTVSKATNIVYGRDQPVYQSIMKNTMIEHNTDDARRVKQQMQEQGKMLRKHNFHLGFDDPRDMAVDTEYIKISGDNSQLRAKSINAIAPVNLKNNEVRKEHVEIGSKFGSTDYTSISKMAQLGLQNLSQSQRNDRINQTQQALKSQMELRKSNFSLGRDANSVMGFSQSNNEQLFSKEKNPSILDKEMIMDKMLRGHITIGDPHNRTMKFAETSYKPAVGALKKDLVQSADTKQHLNVSVSLGSHPTAFVTETNHMLSQIQEQPSKQQHSPLKNLIEKNRSPHFQFGSASKHEKITSVMKSEFDYKGNPAEIRQKLDPVLKQGLRQCNFQMGFQPSVDYQTASQASNNTQTRTAPSAAEEGLMVRNHAKSVLGHSGQRIFSNNLVAGGSTFKTTNQVYTKWIQPAPSQHGVMSSLTSAVTTRV